MSLQKGTKLIAHRLVFYNLNPILLLWNIKKWTQVLCSDNTISQPSLEISPIWLPLIGKELKWDLGYVSYFSPLMFCVGSYLHQQMVWLFTHLTILVFIDYIFYYIWSVWLPDLFYILYILSVLFNFLAPSRNL